jgi:hypothetical protein
VLGLKGERYQARLSTETKLCLGKLGCGIVDALAVFGGMRPL